MLCKGYDGTQTWIAILGHLPWVGSGKRKYSWLPSSALFLKSNTSPAPLGRPGSPERKLLPAEQTRQW